MWNPQWTWGRLLIFYLEYSKPWEGGVKQFLKDRHLWPALGRPRSRLLISFVEDGQAGSLTDSFCGLGRPGLSLTDFLFGGMGSGGWLTDLLFGIS